MAGVTWWNFYFRLFPGAIRTPQIIEFLSHLLRHIPGKLLIVWDGLPGHRSRITWEFIRQQRGRLWVEFLPAYAPELNPVEYLWSHWKQHELPNLCPPNIGKLRHHARRAPGGFAELQSGDAFCHPLSSMKTRVRSSFLGFF